MLSLFKHKALKKQDRPNAAHDSIAGHIFNIIIRSQEACAAFLQRKTNKLSKAAKICLLLTFCLFSSGYSLYHFKYSFTTNNKTHITFEKILNIDNTINPNNVILKSNKQIEQDGYRRIQQFLRYTDSLDLTVSGRKTSDSILKSRPGLMDSVRYCEKMFQSQSTNK